MSRPTDSAKMMFDVAQMYANNALVNIGTERGEKDQVMAIYQIAAGLKDLTVGLRATYILLERVEGLLQQQTGAAPKGTRPDSFHTLKTR